MRQLLQVCPNDHPPFRDLCSFYDRAARLLDIACTTIFLKPPTRNPMDGDEVVYLQDSETFQSALGRLDNLPTVVISHRYRAWQKVTASRLKPDKHLLVAHAFGTFRSVQRKLRFRFLGGATQLAGVSSAVARDLHRETGRTPIVLPNVVDLEALDARRLSRKEARMRLRLPEHGYIVGVVGRLHWWKQPQLALRGFAQANLSDAHICFLGSGEQEADLQALNENLGTEAFLCGFVEDAAIYFKAFDTILVASNHKEAFGMITIEALSAGVPVVCSDQPALREVLGDLATYIEPLTPEGVALALQMKPATGATLLRRRVEQNFSIGALAGNLEKLFSPQAES